MKILLSSMSVKETHDPFIVVVDADVESDDSASKKRVSVRWNTNESVIDLEARLEKAAEDAFNSKTIDDILARIKNEASSEKTSKISKDVVKTVVGKGV